MSTADRLKASVLKVTKDWAKQRKAEERHRSAIANRMERLTRVRYWTFKDAAAEVMEKAYMAASANGTLPASARQVMYQARPSIQETMGRQLDDQYFCQQLLPDYIEERGVDWDVVFDDRGHFREPHTGHTIGLGTLSVRSYLNGLLKLKHEEPGFSAGEVTTRGPDGCFGGVMFIEKEGFLPLFESTHLAERHDIAIMSTKGMSSTAARTLIDQLCEYRIPLFVLHDFDKAGFSIVGTLKRNTRRYSFSNEVKVIDLGLRLADVQSLGLEGSAEDAFDRGDVSARRQNLRLNSATQEEIDFLLHRRVELNALTSDQLLRFIEGKLAEHGVKKVVPDTERLNEAYRLFVNSHRIQEIVEKAMDELEEEEIDTPTDLEAKVREHLKEHPEMRWDEAVAKLAEEHDE